MLIVLLNLFIWFNIYIPADAFRLNNNNYCSSNRCLQKLTVTQLHLYKSSSSTSTISSRSCSISLDTITYRRNMRLLKSASTHTMNMIHRRKRSSSSCLYMNSDVSINIDDQMNMITAFNRSSEQGLMMSSSSLRAIIGRQVVSLGMDLSYISYNTIHHHIISYHLASHHVTSYYIISPDIIIWCNDMMWYDVRWYYMIWSHHITWHFIDITMTSHHINVYNASRYAKSDPTVEW